ncbi:hypothetical protein AKL17_3p0081 (plasmid) [Frigidibacter mobilis]|uniref:Secreted protein n=1 Tax=Frigidibacter mobilis TaxID=1335048 RepID=A0A159Z9H5_9RHOB|nr:hypothetical protein AKL17_3p0081 [Frigidibacter mobilis]
MPACGRLPRALCSAASAFSCAASSTPWASSASSSGRLNWSGDSFSERLPNFSRCAACRISCSRRLASCVSASVASTSARRAFSRAFSRARSAVSMREVNHGIPLQASKKRLFSAFCQSSSHQRTPRAFRPDQPPVQPSNRAASCADDIRITPPCTCGQTNLASSNRL